MKKFGNWINKEELKEVREEMEPDLKVAKFRVLMQRKVYEIFPVKTVKIFNKDEEFMDENLHKKGGQKRENIEERRNMKETFN